ncbi:MarR family winged helix-turn-helix transcriptional regulator [Saccharibacillus sp. CPCC 101409]|uniref:MarR family winged helix-turn-helix transcriptional regulator n=1 Tax=Saccharibacillus sp. CPCC 101409 TaxID=3058041 RepID=UPI002671426F|nr:MarR family winged helix-turn-helix transcriptional regulator [Saccharibacillus sp. CPCC 101409]MDO3411348.1 MarR family winged helix-turn-helix transcriptional regulator [Saccharibacillus sp. CPCC 101409]
MNKNRPDTPDSSPDETAADFGLFDIEQALGFVLNRAAIVMRMRLTAMFRSAGYEMSTEEFVILARLWARDGMFQSEIVEQTLKDKTRVTRLLGGLIMRGWIEKRTDENDRRNFRVYLTEEGRSLRPALLPLVAAVIAAGSADIPQEDLDTTVRTLRRIFDNLSGAAEPKGDDYP